MEICGKVCETPATKFLKFSVVYRGLTVFQRRCVYKHVNIQLILSIVN
jgi:hypothetical protein